MPAIYNGQEVVFGLDIGTRSIVGTVGYKDARNRFQVVAQEERFHETRAMMDGQIHDISKVAETICLVKETLEEKLHITLTEVCIAAAGRVLKTAVGACEEELGEDTVVDDELVYSLDMLGVERANEQIMMDKDSDETFFCVGYTVVRYFLNGYAITNLIGHKAHKVGAEVLATFLPEDVVDGLYAAIHEAGLEVVNLTLEPIAAMNVAIPEQYRLLNIALVDVGAGTSDICITKDGSIVAYGMIPYAGDKLTEVLVQKYLIDFDTAEKIKMMPPTRKTMQYKDIMGDKQKITRQELVEDLEPSIRQMCGQISDKIRELNGGNAVSAVFVVGGGGKIEGFTQCLSEALGLSSNRVALRGAEVMGSIDMLDETLKKDSLYVTPIGICINYYEKKNNFIYVHVNKERIKLYNNNKLTIMDAAAAASYPNECLFPRRGADITFTLNGKQRMVRGNKGEAAQIHLNHKLVSMTSPISANDKIVITESTVGEPAYKEVGQLPEYADKIHFRVNGQTITCPKFVMVNGEIQTEYYSIKDQDQVNILDYYTVEQLLLYLDLPSNVSFYINHETAGLKDRIYDNYMINWAYDEETLASYEKQEEQAQPLDDAEEKEETPENAEGKKEYTKDPEENKTEIEEVKQKEPHSIHITVNDQPVVLSDKEQYIFVDILDVYPFDLTVMGGSELITTLNEMPVEFTHPLHEGDVVRIYWKE